MHIIRTLFEAVCPPIVHSIKCVNSNVVENVRTAVASRRVGMDCGVIVKGDGGRRFFSALPNKSHYWANQAPTVYSTEDIKKWTEKFPQLGDYEFVEVQKWRNVFDTYDHDNDGYISPADFQKNPNLSLEKVQLLKEADRDKNNLIDFGEFVEAISSLDVVDLRRRFDGFDSVDIQLEFEKFAIRDESLKKKCIGLRELKKLMSYCECICVTDKDAQKLLTEMDKGNDGFVDFEEFKNVISI